MTVKSTAVSVTNTATRLDTAAETDNDNRSSVLPFNNSGVTVFVGGADVTTANGVPVAAGEYGIAADVTAAEGYYGIVVSGTAEMRVFETGL